MKTVLCAIAILAGVGLTQAGAADEVYRSNFDQELDQWQGRPGLGEWRKPELALTSNDARKSGENVLQVETDGRIGTGIELKPIVPLEKGKTYVLTYYVRTAAALPVTFRLIDIDLKGIPTNEAKWNRAPESNGDWVEVVYEFTATSTPIGVEIAAGSDKYEPTTLAIADLTVKEAR
jgi:hypothetical protein